MVAQALPVKLGLIQELRKWENREGGREETDTLKEKRGETQRQSHRQ